MEETHTVDIPIPVDVVSLTWTDLASKWFENLKKEICDDHLDNTFSTNNNDGKFYLSGAVQEGLLIGSKYNEKRQQVAPSLYNYTGSIGQIVSCFIVNGEEWWFVGTGSIQYSTEYDTFFVITWAHNFINQDEYSSGSYKKTRNSTIFIWRDGEDKYSFKIPLENYFVHPRYFNTLDSGYGYDLAVSSFKLEDAVPAISDIAGMKQSLLSIVPSFPEPEQHSKGSTIEVIGYPGEKESRLYRMQGTIHDTTKYSGGKDIMLYNDLDTTGGQSGSPVFKSTSYGTYELVGIHVAYISAQGVNFATSITKELKDWLINKLATWAKHVPTKKPTPAPTPTPVAPSYDPKPAPTAPSYVPKPSSSYTDPYYPSYTPSWPSEPPYYPADHYHHYQPPSWPSEPPSTPPDPGYYSYSSQYQYNMPSYPSQPSYPSYPSYPGYPPSNVQEWPPQYQQPGYSYQQSYQPPAYPAYGHYGGHYENAPMQPTVKPGDPDYDKHYEDAPDSD